jgi:hypothetical protein
MDALGLSPHGPSSPAIRRVMYVPQISFDSAQGRLSTSQFGSRWPRPPRRRNESFAQSLSANAGGTSSVKALRRTEISAGTVPTSSPSTSTKIRSVFLLLA